MARRAFDGTPRFTSLQCDKTQIPPDGIFTSQDILWYCEEAFIPLNTLDDFINGEEAKPNSLCRFNKKKLVDRLKHGSISRAYQCYFGPTDLREKVITRAPSKRTTSDGKHPMARSTELGLSSQRGCQCRFIVIQYKERQDDVKLRWLNRDHFDISGRACHGLADRDAIYAKAHVPHTLSKPLRQFVERLLLSQVDAVSIVAAHYKMVKDEVRTDDFSDAPLLWSRDMQLSYQDVLNVQATMKARSAYTQKNDHLNLALWVEANPQHVLFYEPGSETPYKPFAIVLAKPWQLKQLATLGHGNAVSMDATFGTNEYEFQLFTLVCFDAFQNGIPCAWGIMERHQVEDLTVMLAVIKNRVEAMRSETLHLPREWSPSCFVVDVAPEEALAIRMVFPHIRILLCFYHVRKSWRRNVYSKVKTAAHKSEINRELGSMMYNHIQKDPVVASNEFIQRWATVEREFVSYYRAHWHRKLETWVRTFRHFPHANQNTNGAIERYHKTLKNVLKVDKKVKSGRKITWLVEKLLDEVEHWFWMRSGQKSQGTERNTIAESQLMKALDNARDIADVDVVFIEVDGRKVGHVISSTHRDRFHVVENYDKDCSTCTCVYGLEGNTCKHKIKCLLLTGHGEVSLLLKLGTLLGTICGGLDYAARSATGAGVGPDSVVTDINYATRHQHDEVHSTPATQETPVAEDNSTTRPPPARADVPITKDDLLKFVDDAYEQFADNQRILKHGIRGMSSWIMNLREIDARINPADPRDIHAHMAPTAIPFRTVPGSNSSLRPLTSFVDRIGRKQRRTRRMPNPYSGIHAPHPFRKAPSVKETWQQRLDREALEDLVTPSGNESVDGSQGSQNSQQSTGRGHGRGGGRRGRGRGPVAGTGRDRGQMQSNRPPLQEIDLNVDLGGTQEFNYNPCG